MIYEDPSRQGAARRLRSCKHTGNVPPMAIACQATGETCIARQSPIALSRRMREPSGARSRHIRERSWHTLPRDAMVTAGERMRSAASAQTSARRLLSRSGCRTPVQVREYWAAWCVVRPWTCRYCDPGAAVALGDHAQVSTHRRGPRAHVLTYHGLLRKLARNMRW